MANLKYKTRGNSNPQGKPKVYFCCHPEDFNKYFETIYKEVLAKQNCAVWYTDEVVAYDDDFFLDLKQMQLFVMPITTNLLCTENEAIDIEFRFAIENHIPVLPLMQENGLEELFNKKCGDLQFLDKNNADVTAISYEDKLQKYLETVLIGDELAEKIRTAFDAYVFLSYRKKDRRYAQELMRLIHKNEFCRDVAIWYDEFLTPGENFNDSIKEALQKSGLFVLTVTPNLINEQNYIMTTEYPMAKREGKPILPAELVPTDKEGLLEKYEGIPYPTDAYNDEELSGALLESIKKMAIKESDISPEHNFFIGLAYLGGVDVEVDFDKAIELITSAANDDLPEAVKKLADMYSEGVGVKRSISEAINWQKKLVSICEKSYASGKLSVMRFLDEAWILGGLLNKNRNYTDARIVYAKILEISNEKIERGDKCEPIVYYFCIASNNLGSLYYGRDKKQAFLHYNHVIECCAKMEHLSSRLKQQKSVSLLNMGIFYEEDDDTKSALKYYEESLKIRNQLFKRENIRSIKDLYLCYHNISLCYNRTNNLEGALMCLRKIIELKKMVLELTKNHYAIIDELSELINSYITLAKTLLQKEKKKEVKRSLLEARTVIGSYYNVLPEFMHEDLLRKEGEILFETGKAYEQMSEYVDAKECYRLAVEKFTQAYKKSSAINDNYRCAVSLSGVAGIDRKLGRYNASQQTYREAIEILSPKTMQTTSETIQNGIAVLYFNAATVNSKNINRELLSKACSIWELLSRQYPHNKTYSNYYRKAKELLNM